MKKYDGWIAKDKHGDYWYGTFETTESAVRSHIKGKWKEWKLKIVKIKFVEVKE